MRVGIGFTGDAGDRTARSGTPFGVLNGSRTQGVDALALRATPGRNLDRAVAAVDALAHVAATRRSGPDLRSAYSAAHLARLTSLARSLPSVVRARRLRLDHIIALGSGYALPNGIPFVVYDDMTVVQAIEAGYPEWTSMRESDRRFRVRQQRKRYASARACCMTTSWAARSVVEDYGIDPAKVVVVGAGTHETIRKVTRDWSTPRYLFVGLNWQRKNGPRVLAAFASVRLHHPSATLDVVGGHPPISQDGVRTHGRLYRDRPDDQQQLSDLFDRATCFVMPSLHEPGGVVFVEASSVGLGSIGGSIGGSADFIGDAGRIVDPFDQSAITAAMMEMADPAEAESAGRLALERATLFTWPQVAGRLLSALGAPTSAPWSPLSKVGE